MADGVEKMSELDHAVVVIPDRQVVERRGATIAAPIRKDHSVGRAEHRDRIVERHDAAAPAAVETNQRRGPWPVSSYQIRAPGILDERHEINELRSRRHRATGRGGPAPAGAGRPGMKRASVSGQPSSGASYVSMRIGLTSVFAVSRVISGPGRRAALEEVRGDGEEDIGAAGEHEARRPSRPECPAPGALAPEPASMSLRRDQHLDQAGEQEAERQLEPDAARRAARSRRGRAAAGAESRANATAGRGDDEPEQDPEARVHPSLVASRAAVPRRPVLEARPARRSAPRRARSR